ncbi:MAG TPA: PPK2 family polyphosphate kinase [Verrucomicrobiales bacterium]|jgi:PPK2 family polyphosphate:nucleotide phosphotransferase|nr:PPK2 family polyphosphate kinase [Verrucomicrobiales bacterium]
MKVFRIKPGTRVKLAGIDPEGEPPIAGDKDQGLRELEAIREDIRRLQRMLYAERKHRLLVILQGLDGSGKDGTVRHVFHGIDPHGLRVVAFKSPTAIELDHDFLWRVHQEVPARGELVVFNRSHYEDVVAVSVKNLAPKAVWDKRFDHIVNFERLLTDEGTTILKFFLHISREEQRRRLQARLENPDKHWKFHPDDLSDSKRWPEFVEAYEEAINRTGSEAAPWYIIPGNRKWYRNIAIASIVRDALARLELKFPPPAWNLKGLEIA